MQDQGNLTELTVSELSQALKRVVETTFDFVRVRGEISGFKRAASGHVYLTLKDDRAVIDGVCWRGQAARLDCRPEDGLDVVVTGKLTTYPGRSKYQIVIETMQLAGLGALMKLFEERKKKLAEEGLFNSDRKKKIPFLPERIGVVTSPTGAVIRDILHRLNERFPRHVLVWPVLVQGEGSAQQIASAIQGFNDLPPPDRPDLLIVARGGGSIEDLWAFNEEIVVRAAFASRIPLISAVGHETDTTLIDFASDFRAPTPTAAAEIAVPVRRDLIATVEQAGLRLTNGINRFFDGLDRHLTGLARGLPAPTLLIGHAQQRLDDQSERLRLALTTHMRQGRSQLLERAAKLVSPRQLLAFARKQLQSEAQQLERRLPQRLERMRERLTSQSNLFESLSHKRVLERGYALVRRPSDGALIATARDALAERRLSLTFQDDEIEVSPSAKTDGHGKPAKKAGETGRQGRLL